MDDNYNGQISVNFTCCQIVILGSISVINRNSRKELLSPSAWKNIMSGFELQLNPFLARVSFDVIAPTLSLIFTCSAYSILDSCCERARDVHE